MNVLIHSFKHFSHPIHIMYKRLILFLAFMGFVASFYAQSILFDHLQMEDGLSECTIQAIYQDEMQRMWIATRDGLNFYDGKNMKVFRPVIGDTTSISGHNVINVTGNGKGKIYIHCMVGVLSYDLRKEQLSVIATSGIERIAMGKNHLWTSFKNKIYSLNSETEKLELYQTFNPEINITSIYELDSKALCIGTRDHGLLISDNRKTVKTLIPNQNIICIFQSSQKELWIGTLKNGLYHIDRQSRITNYKYSANNENSISNNFVRSINEDNLGNLWVGTFDGLNQFNTRKQQFIAYYHTEQKRHSIGNNSIWCITKDAQGSMWIGSYYGGVDIFDPESLANYYTPGNNESGLCDGIVGSIAEDPEGNLWICSENTGLNYFNRGRNTFKWYPNENLGISTDTKGSLKALHYDSQENCLWFGTHLNGLHKMEMKTKQVVRVNFTDKNSGNDYVRCIIPYKDRLLLGTHNSVYLFDKTTRNAVPLLDNEKYKLTDRQIWDMFIDSQNRFWFSTSSEVYCYSLNDQELSIYKYDVNDTTSLQSGNLFTFTEDKEQRIWIGSTGGGISLFNERHKSFIRFDSSNSTIIDCYVIDIVATPSNYILVATNKGISRFDYQTNTFQNYYSNDIFYFSGLKEHSFYITKSNEIIVGSINGFAIMNETDFDIKMKEYSINFFQLYINNSAVKPGDETHILTQSIDYTDRIDLYKNHTVFCVDFAVTNYIKALHPVIHYKLEGFDEKWISADSHDRITYTNLAPGKYKLIVKAQSGQNEGLSTYRELIIIVHPPFYKTILAYSIYAVLLLLAIYLYFRYYKAHIRLKSLLEFSEKEKKHIEQLNQMKLQFFTNISHELRTPVTLIISQIESILQLNTLPATASRKVLSVLRNTDKMHRLINELLDFRRQEKGFLTLKVSEQDLIKYIADTCEPFKEYAEEREIHFSICSTETRIPLWFDKLQLEKVIYNLLSNAFRFTPAKGKVKLKIICGDKNVSIQVNDTGHGISSEAIHHIFDHFYQENNPLNNRGSGIGLALTKGIIELHGGEISVASEADKGSTFTVKLPKGNSHLQPKQIQKEGDAPTETIDTRTWIPGKIKKPVEPFVAPNKEDENQKSSILIVEDNPEILAVLSDIFAPFYQTHTATNGAEGLEVVEKLQPDLILSDIMMPVMNGLEFCKKIKSNLNTCHIPVVLLTARAAVEHILFGLSSGADDYIIKPFNTQLLLARCNSIINNRRMLQTFYQNSPGTDTKMIATNELDQTLLEKATRIVEVNIQNVDFNIEQFAHEMCLGRTALFQKMKGITGQTPNDFILMIRLKKSLVLLKEAPQLPIYQIAMMVGFNEDTYFMRCFKKHFGKTPSQYREE